MRIQRLDLIAYGGFTNHTLNFAPAPSQMHVVYGPNESGKSTTLRGIAAWLFGFPTRSDDSYLHSYANLRVGGVLHCPRLGTLECIRRKGRENTLLTPDADQAIDEAVLQRFLGNVDEDTFLRGFGIDRNRLIDGGRDIIAGAGELGEILFSAGVGLNHLNQVRQDLEKQASNLYLTRGKNPTLNKIIAELRELKSALNQATLSTTVYRQQQETLVALRQNLEQAEHRKRTLTRALRHRQAIREAKPLVDQWTLVVKQLTGLAQVPVIDDDFVARRRQADNDLRLAEAALADISQREQDLQNRLEKLPDHSAVLQLAARIRSLLRQARQYESVETDHQQWLHDQRRLQQEISKAITDLGYSADKDLASLQLSTSQREQLWQLAEEGLQLDQQLRLHNQQLEELELDLAAAQQALTETPPAKDCSRLRSTLDQIEPPGRLLDELARIRTHCQRAAERAEKLLQRIPSFQGTVAEAVRLQLPSLSTVTDLGLRCQQNEQQFAELRRETSSLAMQNRQITAELEALLSSGIVPSEEELRQARGQRDAIVEQWKSSTAHSWAEVDDLENAVLHADQLVDALRTSADQVAARRRLELERARLSSGIASNNEQLAELQSQRETLLKTWRELWNNSGLSIALPSDLGDLYARHEDLIQAAEETTQLHDQLQQLQQQCDRDCERLTSSLAGLGIDAEHPSDDTEKKLLAVYTQTIEVRDREADRAQRYEAAEKECARISQQVQRQRRGFENNTRLLQQWQPRWQQAIASLSANLDWSPQTVRKLVEAHDALTNKHQQLIGIEANIRRANELEQTLVDEIEQLVVDFHRLAVSVDLTTNTSQRWRQIVAIEQLLNQAEAAEQERTLLLEQIDKLTQQSEARRSQRQNSQAVLDGLCVEVDVAENSELPTLERLSAQKRDLQREQQQITLGLKRLADGLEVETFIAEVSAIQTSDLQDQIDSYQEQLETTERELAELNQQLGAEQTIAKTMSGGSQAADFNQQIESVAATGQRHLRSYVLLTMQMIVLQEAIEHYRQQNQGPVLSRAEKIFSALTCGRYAALQPQIDEKGQRVLVAVRSDTAAHVQANQLSEGTADALFLALRLASLEAHLENRDAIPLIIDDILVQLDDERCIEALKVLASIAEKTQVIYFTHHRHVLDMLAAHLPSESYVLHQL